MLFIYQGQIIYYRNQKILEKEKNSTKPCFLNSCDKGYKFYRSPDQLIKIPGI